jgi:hypothetical protein
LRDSRRASASADSRAAAISASRRSFSLRAAAAAARRALDGVFVAPFRLAVSVSGAKTSSFSSRNDGLRASDLCLDRASSFGETKRRDEAASRNAGERADAILFFALSGFVSRRASGAAPRALRARVGVAPARTAVSLSFSFAATRLASESALTRSRAARPRCTRCTRTAAACSTSGERAVGLFDF